MPKVPPGSRCEADEGSADGLEDGAGAGEASNSPDGGVGEASDSADEIPSECDAGTGLLEKESRPLILSRRDSNLALTLRMKPSHVDAETAHIYQYVLFVAACSTRVLLTVEALIMHSIGNSCWATQYEIDV